MNFIGRFQFQGRYGLCATQRSQCGQNSWSTSRTSSITVYSRTWHWLPHQPQGGPELDGGKPLLSSTPEEAFARARRLFAIRARSFFSTSDHHLEQSGIRVDFARRHLEDVDLLLGESMAWTGKRISWPIRAWAAERMPNTSSGRHANTVERLRMPWRYWAGLGRVRFLD